jgi:hypothetical protein
VFSRSTNSSLGSMGELLSWTVIFFPSLCRKQSLSHTSTRLASGGFLAKKVLAKPHIHRELGHNYSIYPTGLLGFDVS